MSQEIDSGLIEKKDEQINNTNISIGNNNDYENNLLNEGIIELAKVLDSSQMEKSLSLEFSEKSSNIVTYQIEIELIKKLKENNNSIKFCKSDIQTPDIYQKYVILLKQYIDLNKKYDELLKKYNQLKEENNLSNSLNSIQINEKEKKELEDAKLKALESENEKNKLNQQIKLKSKEFKNNKIKKGLSKEEINKINEEEDYQLIKTIEKYSKLKDKNAETR